jgi:hypothetical protein
MPKFGDLYKSFAQAVLSRKSRPARQVLMFKFDFTPKLYDSLERIVSEILNM